MNKFFLLLTLLLPYGSVAYAACTGIPADLTEPNYGVEQWLGGGYDRDRERISVNTCLNGEKVRETGSSSAEFFVGLLTDYQEVYREIQRSNGGKIKIGWFSFGKSRSFTEKITDKAYTQSFVLVFDIKTGNGRFAINSNDPLNNLADRVKHDACEFKKFCGDSFVFQTEEGVKLLLGIQISFSSNNQFQEYKNGFSAGVEGAIKKTFDICTACGKVSLPLNISFIGDFNKSLDQITKSQRQQGRIEIFAMQQGGDVARLGQALGANGALGSCSLDNRAACLQMADNALAYIASEEFIQGVKDTPAVLNYAMRSYNEVDPYVPNLATEITPEIENARQQLAAEFDNRLADMDVLDATLGLALSYARRQQLEQLQTELKAEIQNLYQTGLLCFSDLANCPQEAAQVLAELKAYDRAVVHTNPADGLVAYYPFNANALDESGNGNDGTVYGATLVQDRNGNEKSAFNFKDTAFIKVNDSNSLDLSGNLTLSGWVYGSNNSHAVIIAKPEGIHGYSFGTYNAKSLHFSAMNNNFYYNSNLYVAGQWSFVAVSYDNNYLRYYVDGKLDSEIKLSGNIGVNDSELYIGTNNVYSNYSSPFTGSIDDIRIYNRALTAPEIKQLDETSDSQLNQPPLAMFSTSVTQNMTINLNASDSRDADGSINRYEWLSSDGQMTSGKTASLNFANPGEYSITLTITDNQRATSQAVKNIRVTASSEPSNPTPNPVTGCTNTTISDCRANYLNGTVCVPCVIVPGAFGITQIFALEMQQSNPSILSFEVDPLTLKQHDFRDNCAANYAPAGGLLNLPCVSVDANSYDVDMQQRPGSLIFDVTGVRK